MSTKAVMTIEQFEQMETAETVDFELVDGELIQLSSGTPRDSDMRVSTLTVVSGKVMVR